MRLASDYKRKSISEQFKDLKEKYLLGVENIFTNMRFIAKNEEYGMGIDKGLEEVSYYPKGDFRAEEGHEELSGHFFGKDGFMYEFKITRYEQENEN